MAIELIKEAVAAGARRSKACEILNISLRTLQRWENAGGDGDQRRGPSCYLPAPVTQPCQKEMVKPDRRFDHFVK